MMAKRKGKGAGKGKGWKNLIASDSYRHELSRRGIKSKQVSITKTKRNKLKKTLLPLMADKTISGYNIVENPNIKPKDKYQVVYGHDVIAKHRDIIVDELRRKNLDFYVMPREAKFLSEDAFIKTKSQVKEGDIVSNDFEYQVVVDVNSKELEDLERYLRTKTVNYDPAVLLFEGTLNPTKTNYEVIPLNEAYTVPDVRIRNRGRYDRFKKVDKIVKKLDKDTNLVILSVRKDDTVKIKKVLKGEKVKKVLVQNYDPYKHSLYKFIKDNTK